MELKNAFGIYLRAARLGFHWCSPAQAYVRVATIVTGEASTYQIETARELADLTPTNRMHIRWWEGDPAGVKSVGDHHGMTLWSLCRGLREMEIPGSIIVNDDGEKIE